jgi:sugar (pentulose or hexulose) kinase
MPEKSHPEERSAILKELAELHKQLSYSRLYNLDGGKWDPAEIAAALELRKTALEKTLEAVKSGHNRGTIVESMLSYFGLNPFYPPML